MLAVVFATMLAACAGAPAQSPVVNSQPNAAFLGPWVTFPVQASPRPIVLIDGPVVMSAGFRFPDGPSKVAFQNGAVDPPAQLPTGPAASQSYPLITAASAVALLQSASTGKAPTTAPSAGGRLRIASARLGEATFLTDRGLKSLPAWVFSLAGIDGAFSVLAVAPSAQWAPPGSAPMSPPGRPDIGAIIAADHRTLTLGFTGAPSVQGACGVRYTLELTEAATAVLATVINRPNDSTAICTLVGAPRKASAVLGSPLGNRVVIEGFSGSVIAATGSP